MARKGRPKVALHTNMQNVLRGDKKSSSSAIHCVQHTEPSYNLYRHVTVGLCWYTCCLAITLPALDPLSQFPYWTESKRRKNQPPPPPPPTPPSQLTD